MSDHTVLRYDSYCPYQSVVTPVSLIKFGIMDAVRLKIMKKNLAFPHFSRKPIPALIKWGQDLMASIIFQLPHFIKGCMETA